MIYDDIITLRYIFIYYAARVARFDKKKRSRDDKDRVVERNGRKKGTERENREEHMLGVFVVPLGVAGRVAYPPITGSPLASSSLC